MSQLGTMALTIFVSMTWGGFMIFVGVCIGAKIFPKDAKKE